MRKEKIRQCQVVQFGPLLSGPAMSGPAFSTPLVDTNVSRLVTLYTTPGTIEDMGSTSETVE